MSGFRAATAADLTWIAPTAIQEHLIADEGELRAALERDPWSVQITDRGEAVVLERWRDWGSECAILGLWCSPGRLPVLVGEIERIALEHGFTRVIGPLVLEDVARSYLRAGMRSAERVTVMRRQSPSRPNAILPDGVTLRCATRDDLPLLAELDSACFDDFWRYDARLLERSLRMGRVAVAEKGGELIGYTLATIYGVDGSLGRLAVLPRERRRGVGGALAAEAITWMADRGVRVVVLGTQEDNDASKTLYRLLGFVEMPRRLIVCASDDLRGPREER